MAERVQKDFKGKNGQKKIFNVWLIGLTGEGNYYLKTFDISYMVLEERKWEQFRWGSSKKKKKKEKKTCFHLE